MEIGNALIKTTRSFASLPLINLKSFARGFAGMSRDVVTGLNISKTGSDPPLKSDEELPDWLWKLASPDKTLGELRRSNQKDFEFEDLKRLAKLENRDSIRTRNSSKSK